MSEQTSNPTSGQNVPKSKFRRKSRQEQTAASKLRMERRGEKLDAAREKLAKQKPPKKPGAVKRLAHTAGHGVHGFVHGKFYEVEHENVGTEGAHRSELAAESVYRFGRRKLRKAIREHPAKAVERAESKHIKATADYYYRKTVEEHPEMQEGGAASRYLQKQKIKHQYAKQAREAARQTAKAAEGTASVTGKLTEKVSAYIKEHPGGLLLLLAAFLLLVVLQYNYYICYVTLENFNLSHLPVYIMGEETLSRYALYMATLGNRPDLFPSSGYVPKYVTSPPAKYEIPAEYLSDERFAALITEAEKYLGFPYVWGGSSPSTSFDCSGFVSYVLTSSGLCNTGRLGAQGLYNISTPVSEPQPGDLVFFVGTYDTPGVSHVGFYVGDGMLLHCGDPIQYTSLNSNYWQSHLYAYGRPPYN